MAGETNPALAANAAARKSPLPARKKKVRIAPVRRASKAHHTLMVNEKAEKPKIIVGYRKNAGDWRYPQSNRFVVRSGRLRETPSVRVIREVAHDLGINYRFDRLALDAIQDLTEAWLVDLFESANLCAIQAKRVTVMKKDFQQALKEKTGLFGMRG